MTRDEAIDVLKILTTAHPKITLTEHAISIWYECTLRTMDHTLGRKIALDCVAEIPEFPTPAAYNAIRRRHFAALAPKPKPAEPEEWQQLPSEKARAEFDKLRETLGWPKQEATETE